MDRRLLLRSVAGIAGAGLAGCVETESDGPTTTVAPVSSDLVASGSGPFPHEIEVRNRGDATAAVTVRVDREGETLYRRTHSVPPTDAGRVVAGITEKTLPEADQTLDVSLTHADRTRSVSVDIDDCLGGVFAAVGGSEGLDLTISVC